MFKEKKLSLQAKNVHKILCWKLIARISETSNLMTIKSAVRGFHVYRSCWQPQENKLLKCFDECNNAFDIFHIHVYLLETNKKVGH